MLAVSALIYDTKEVKSLTGFRYLSETLVEIWYQSEFTCVEDGQENKHPTIVNQVLCRNELKLSITKSKENQNVVRSSDSEKTDKETG